MSEIGINEMVRHGSVSVMGMFHHLKGGDVLHHTALGSLVYFFVNHYLSAGYIPTNISRTSSVSVTPCAMIGTARLRLHAR